jgi:hypothetical protein
LEIVQHFSYASFAKVIGNAASSVANWNSIVSWIIKKSKN